MGSDPIDFPEAIEKTVMQKAETQKANVQSQPEARQGVLIAYLPDTQGLRDGWQSRPIRT